MRHFSDDATAASAGGRRKTRFKHESKLVQLIYCIKRANALNIIKMRYLHARKREAANEATFLSRGEILTFR